MTTDKNAATTRQSQRVRACIAASLDAQETGDTISGLITAIQRRYCDWDADDETARVVDAVIELLRQDLARHDDSARRWAQRADELLCAGPSAGQS